MYTVGLDELVSLILFIIFSKIGLMHKEKNISENIIKENIKDDNNIKEIIFGSILGDGQLEMPPRGKNARFGFIQSESKKSYFLCVFNQLISITNGKYREYSYEDKRTGKLINL